MDREQTFEQMLKEAKKRVTNKMCIKMIFNSLNKLNKTWFISFYLVDVADLPDKYQYGDVQAYEPDYPEELLERDAFNALFAEAAAQEVEEDLDEDDSGLLMRSSLPEEGVNLKEYLSELEINLIRQALEQQDWVVARAADKLGMRRTTLVEKMRKYDIQRVEEV